MHELEIQVEYCRRRQQRLLAEMQRLKVDWVIVQTTEHVQWLAGPRFAWLVEAAALLTAEGRCTLFAPDAVEAAAADDVVRYDARWLGTLRNDQRQACSEAIVSHLAGKPRPKRLGVEFSCFSPYSGRELNAELVDVEPELFRLRRRKEPDELARLKKAIAGTRVMYERAREIIEPGVNELDVFNELQAAAVREFGEMLTGTGNDYA
ncbi:MAG: M24 family metallopeptidase, partial [Candidatus Saccharimonadales bacterium]